MYRRILLCSLLGALLVGCNKQPPLTTLISQSPPPSTAAATPGKFTRGPNANNGQPGAQPGVAGEIANFKSFAFNFSLPNLEGKTVSLKDYAGKVLIADIWGTWCPPCRAEIPHFIELYKKYKQAGLEIVGLNYENGKNKEEVVKGIKDFVKANNMPYTCVIGDEKTRQQVPNFGGFPTTLFIDRAGKVRLVMLGLQPAEKLESVVKALLDETEKTASTTEKSPTSDLLAKANGELQHRNFTGAISTLEELIKEEPKNRQGLVLLVSATQQYGMIHVQGGNQEKGLELFLNSAKYAKQLRTAYPELNAQEEALLANALYNEACAEAQKGKTESALSALQDALASGFSDMAQIAKDTDLDSLRKLPKFQQIVTEGAAAAAAHATKQVKKELAGFKSFAFDFSLPNLEGKTVALKDYAGKVVIADIWGTWCPPCRAEIPHFVELHKKYQKAGLEIVGLNYERGSKDGFTKLIGDFVKENNMTYTCVIGDEKTRSQVPNFEGFPTTLFIDRSGKVRMMMVGLQPYEKLEAVVKTLLDEADVTASR